MRPVPERTAAKASGEQFYETGKPCVNGHVGRRYTANGVCVSCQVIRHDRYMAKGGRPEHPARVIARDAGEIHYSTGEPCKNGHDKRYVTTGSCVQCDVDKIRRWYDRNPGMEAELARKYRAKDPTAHRKASIKWAKNNRGKVADIRKRMIARDPGAWRKKWLVTINNYRAKKAANGGEFTAADIEALYAKQDGKCAACGSHNSLEIDHIIAVSKGGTSDPANLQLLCRKCNRSKGDRDFQEWAIEKGHVLL